MPTPLNLDNTTSPAPVRRGRRRLGALLFILMLGVVLFFGFKVLRYYRQIQTGTLDTASLSFQSTGVSQAKLQSFARSAPGSGQLATSDDPTLGPTDAKLTIVQFADFGCPFSEQENFVVRALAKQYPDDVRIIYRDFPLVDLHPGADLAAEAGVCAHEQGKFWEYHDVLYRNSGSFSADELLDYANQVGLNMPAFQTCLETGRYLNEVAQDLSDGVAAGVTGTPTFFFNGEKIEGAIPFSTFTEIIDAFLAE